MDTILNFKLGFKLEGVYFGWLDGNLYQLPYNETNRYFPLRKLRLKKLTKNGWQYYHVRRKKVGIEKLRAMLQEVDWEVKKPMQL